MSINTEDTKLLVEDCRNASTYTMDPNILGGIPESNAGADPVQCFFDARSYFNFVPVQTYSVIPKPNPIVNTGPNGQDEIDLLENKFPGIKKVFLKKTEANLQALQNGEFKLFDPLLSDWSCQLRALNLWRIIKEKPNLKDLSEIEKLYIGAGIFLTEAISKKQDSLGMAYAQATNETFYPTELSTKPSKMNRKVLFGLTKRFVAMKTNLDLKSWVQISKIPLKQEVQRRMQENTFIQYGGVAVPFLEFFTGYFTFTSLIQTYQIPITILLSQFTRDKATDPVKLNGKTAFLYIYDNRVQMYVRQMNVVPWLQEPTIVIAMYSAKVIGASPQSTNTYRFYRETQDFERFKTLFLQETDVGDLILDIAAAHPQFPNNAYRKEQNKTCTMLEGDLTFMYKLYKDRAEQNNIGTTAYNAAKTKAFETDIPINTKHVYLSTLDRVRQNM